MFNDCSTEQIIEGDVDEMRLVQCLGIVQIVGTVLMMAT